MQILQLAFTSHKEEYISILYLAYFNYRISIKAQILQFHCI